MLVSNCKFRLVLSNLIVFSVCSHSFPYGEHLCPVLAWLNCPPYVFGLTCRILLKSSVTNHHSGHCLVISLESCDPSSTTFDMLGLLSSTTMNTCCYLKGFITSLPLVLIPMLFIITYALKLRALFILK
jgi:hypothetical protein